MNIKFRSIVHRDLDNINKLLKNYNVMRTTGFKDVQSNEEITELMTKWINSKDHFAITLEEEFVGWFMSIPKEDYREVGYMILENFWHQKIAQNALEVFLKNNKGHDFLAKVDKYNMPSIKVLTNNGFIKSHNEEELLIYKYHS